MALVSRVGPMSSIRSETTGNHGVLGFVNNVEASRVKETRVSFSSLSCYQTKGLRRGYRAIVAASPPTEDAVIAAEPLTKEDLVGYLASGCKPKEKWRCSFVLCFFTLTSVKYFVN